MKRYFAIFIIMILGALTTFSWAQSSPGSEALLNKLFAPGPLSEGHKDLEATDCLKCHDAGKGLPQSKCLDCHKDIAAFVQKKKGFHGLTEKNCISCHKEHKGREYDSTLVDQKKFNHDVTGYILSGKHSEIKCSECHIQKRSSKEKGTLVRPNDIRYLGQSQTCISCHRKDDIHSFSGDWSKKDCDSCHNLETWKKVTKFDHDRDTKYKLTGSHSKLNCTDCHAPTKFKKELVLKPIAPKALGTYHWKNLKTSQCLTCHAEFHNQSLGKRFQGGKCDTCHDLEGWKIPEFDHKVTSYKLRGKHAQIKCEECHKQEDKFLKTNAPNFKFRGLTKDCLSCHRDNHFYGTFQSSRLKKPNDCLSCHNESDWKRTHDFNHTVDTRFVIDGKHSDLKCNDCHRPTEQKKGTTLSPVHGKSQGKYVWSHLQRDTCNACHENPHTKTFSKKFLEKKCTDCHVTDDWKRNPTQTKKDFDHETTRFSLTGSHKKVDCSGCHNVNGKQIFKFPSFEQKFCIDCHRNPHEDQFHEKFSSQSCTTCHNTEKFNRRSDFDHSKTSFHIKGKHSKLNCVDCHTPESKSSYEKREVVWHKYIFPGLDKKSCTTCHKDYHDGQLSKRCETCHNEQGWNRVRFDHNKDTDYILKDKHADLKCNECHKPIRNRSAEFGPKNRKYAVIRYSPLPNDCFSCHKKDDNHRGQFGASCQNCHSERGWKVVKDFHKNFTLNGTHFALTCMECHRQDRRLSGMSENCMLCHQRDDVHSGSLPRCGDCHRQQFWEHAQFRHSMTNFPLRGSHRMLDCMDCHGLGIYQGTPSSCVSCHRSDVDNSIFNHAPILNVQDCNSCHNQFTFER